MTWPATLAALMAEQHRLAATEPPPWEPRPRPMIGASYVCFSRGAASPGLAGDAGWSGAACKRWARRAATAVVSGRAGAPYAAGLLALREGPLREAAVRTLAVMPDVLLVDATGRDHPRRAGLALHLGAVLGLPSVGVTDRPLVGRGDEPADRRGAAAPLLVAGEQVGAVVRTRVGVRPVYVSAGWRMTTEVAVDLALAAARRARTPQPLREARRAARHARSRAGG